MLSIIIVNYKSEKETITYLKRELIKVQMDHIIVIVNNEATDESNRCLVNELNAELIIDSSYKPNIVNKVYVLPHKENLGFAKGNNLGAEFSRKYFKVSYFLFSNNDIRFINDNVVEQLTMVLNAKPDVALVGPRVLGLDGSNQSPEPYYKFWNRYIWMFCLPPFLSKDLKNKLFKFDYSQNATEGEHYKVMGSFFMVKAEDFVNCGMMDPNTFLYAEEVILSERLRSTAKKIYYYPEVSVLHEHGQVISAHLVEKRISLLQFSSESYYYRTYKKVAFPSIILGYICLNIYLFFKNLFHNR